MLKQASLPVLVFCQISNLYQISLCKLKVHKNISVSPVDRIFGTSSIAATDTQPCRTHMALDCMLLLRDLTLIFLLDSSSRRRISDLLTAQTRRTDNCRELKSAVLCSRPTLRQPQASSFALFCLHSCWASFRDSITPLAAGMHICRKTPICPLSDCTQVLLFLITALTFPGAPEP